MTSAKSIRESDEIAGLAEILARNLKHTVDQMFPLSCDKSGSAEGVFPPSLEKRGGAEDAFPPSMEKAGASGGE